MGIHGRQYLVSRRCNVHPVTEALGCQMCTCLTFISLNARTYTSLDSGAQAIHERPTHFLEILRSRRRALATFLYPPQA